MKPLPIRVRLTGWYLTVICFTFVLSSLGMYVGMRSAIQHTVKRAKDSGLNAVYFDEKATLFEVHRAALNGYFCNSTESGENRDAARFEKRHREHEKRMLDEVQVYQDVQAVEESRRLEGKAPRVRFFSSEEQQAWERQYPKPPSDLTSEVQRRKGEQG